MASYADVAAHNAPPPSEQPHPDTRLINTTTTPPPEKVQPVSEHKEDTKSAAPPPGRAANLSDKRQYPELATHNSEHERSRERPSRREEVISDYEHWLRLIKHSLLRPGVAGGLVGLANAGCLAAGAYFFVTNPSMRRDRAALSGSLGALATLLSLEYYALGPADIELDSDKNGDHSVERKSARGARIALHSSYQKLFGAVNFVVLSAIAYSSWCNWEKPRWDRKVVSSVGIGLMTLLGGECLLLQNNK